MAKHYSPAPEAVQQKTQAIMERYHANLVENDVTIDILMVQSDNPPALKWAGYPASAVIKGTSLKDRAKGMKDVELIIDEAEFAKLSPEQQDGLLDHELEHIVLKTDEDTGEVLRDDLDRPMVEIKRHDYQFGWFVSIAARHGANSPEVQQAGKIMAEAGMVLFKT